MSGRARGHFRLSAATRYLIVLLGIAAGTACRSEEPSSVWDDLGGTIYFLTGMYQDSVRSVDPRTGIIKPVPQVPPAAYLSASPDGSWLLITARAVLRHDLRTAQTSVIAPNVVESNASYGDISPDGRRVTYTRNDANGYAVMVRNADGTDPRAIVGPVKSWAEIQPTWLDDDRIVFLASAAGEYRLWSVRADGTGLGFFASDTGLIVDAVQPAPQVRRLLVVRRPTGTLPDELWEMDYDGQLTRRLASLSEGAYPWYTWSADARYLAFCITTPESVADLVVLHVGSGQMKSITSEPGYECMPTWAR